MIDLLGWIIGVNAQFLVLYILVYPSLCVGTHLV